MAWGLVVQGIVIGVSIAAPVGPIGVLCIRRTLAEGRLVGLATGLGAATADGLYGFLAAFGLAAASSWLNGGQRWLEMAGGLFLCYLGWSAYRSLPADKSTERVLDSGLLRAYASTFLLTLANPMTIMAFLGILAGLGLAVAESSLHGALLVAGVVLGSASWWLILSAAVSLLRSRFTDAHMRWINRLSGLVIMGFGIYRLALLALVR